MGRPPVLHVTAGAKSIDTLYSQHCALFLDRAVRAKGSPVSARVGENSRRAYAVDFRAFTSSPSLHRVCRGRFFDLGLKEFWFFNILESYPALGERLKDRRAFFTAAREFLGRPDLKGLTYNYVGVESWGDVGLRASHASGWVPGHVPGEVVTFEEELPPVGEKG